MNHQNDNFPQKLDRFPRFFKRKNEPSNYQYFKYYKIIDKDTCVNVSQSQRYETKIDSFILNWCFSDQAEEILEEEAVLL